MSVVYEGHLISKGLKYGIVVGRFNEFITSKLLGGALDALKRHGAEENEIEIAWVPGAFEIPFIAQKLAESGKYDAVITLGAVIRGSTPHFDYVCNEVAKGVAAISLKTGVPTILECLRRTASSKRSSARAQPSSKGWEAASTAIEMANLSRAISG